MFFVDQEREEGSGQPILQTFPARAAVLSPRTEPGRTKDAFWACSPVPFGRPLPTGGSEKSLKVRVNSLLS